MLTDRFGRVTRCNQLGELDAKTKLAENMILFTMGATGTVAFEDGEPGNCRVWMVRRGRYLVERDNDLCGTDVSFTGLYRRR